ncbi:MAG TPA: porin family protein [Bacteroidales bacterium]|nr:porin family protein [Bacteroidales bacterium]
MIYRRYYLIVLTTLLVFFMCNNILLAQKPRLENLPKFDVSPYHFGFTLGFNQMNFSVKNQPDLRVFDSLYVIEPIPQLGFNIGIVSDLRLHDNLNLRFLPTLAFGDRKLNYSIVIKDSILEKITKTVESTYIDLPLYLKFKTNRLVNTRVYVLSGFKYSIDMASQSNKKEKTTNEVLLKLKRNDVAFELGTGFDFYLEYFKFGIEMKMSYGLRDLLKRENDIYTNSIKKLSSKIFWFSFTFE